MPPGEWDKVVAVNLTSMFDVSRLAIPHLKKSQAGSIINLSSIAGLHGCCAWLCGAPAAMTATAEIPDRMAMRCMPPSLRPRLSHAAAPRPSRLARQPRNVD
jgi:NAD(P)-dependent dehydrogenase (short-subunit alcohol dehydrogenase family)